MTLLPFFAPLNNSRSENEIANEKDNVQIIDNVYEVLKRQRRSNALIEAWNRVTEVDL